MSDISEAAMDIAYEAADECGCSPDVYNDCCIRAAVTAAAPHIAAQALRNEPTSVRQAAAEAALIDAWPELADDPVHVEQLAAVTLNAAYNPTWQQHR